MIKEFIEGFRDKEDKLWDVSWREELGEAPQELTGDKFYFVDPRDDYRSSHSTDVRAKYGGGIGTIVKNIIN